MKRIFALALGMALLTADRADAANIAVITTPPNLLHLVVLGVAIACLAAAVKLLMLVRGGQLARGVQLFAGAFALLTICQLAVLFQTMEFVNFPTFVPPLMLAAMSGLFLYGLLMVKKVLD